MWPSTNHVPGIVIFYSVHVFIFLMLLSMLDSNVEISLKENQEESSFPADGHNAILNKMNNKSIKTESGQTLTIRINHTRSTALERSVINYWGD